MNQGLQNPDRLLIVDDDEALLRMLTWTFSDLGYQVTHANTCKKALGAASNQVLDFALLDYFLPDGNGRDLLQSIRRHHPDIIAVLMSANPPGDSEADPGCLAKPVSAGLLDREFRNSKSLN